MRFRVSRVGLKIPHPTKTRKISIQERRDNQQVPTPRWQTLKPTQEDFTEEELNYESKVVVRNGVQEVAVSTLEFSESG